ncbi:hypothetical protein K402DRAFT_390686 [Aulographum hederae CBS 113979]|uniref:FR47-like domain-containing protein n=1 Tax=Aulographum hederae CBS 113979 TaxID=1176131 RepID=A0A6G1H9N1_9PEZI|nr:hypothetical protein K402DRAFT_390686 [Aulographum hederae CBS 113979]
MTSSTYSHPSSGETLLPILHKHLPESLPLYRRLQFHHRSSSSYLLATFPPDSDVSATPQCFTIVYLDRSRRPETEAWIYSSKFSAVHHPASETLSKPVSSCPRCHWQLLSLLAHVRSVPTPPSVHPPSSLKQNDPYTTHLATPTLLLFGAVHRATAEDLHSPNLIPPSLPGLQNPYVKFLFHTKNLPRSVSTTLRPGLRWGQLRETAGDFQLVRSRTAIPRLEATMRQMVNVAVFPAEESSAPVAWGFLGPDASLSSLHVEPEYRGQGLAKAVTARLWGEMGAFDPSEGEEELGWLVHSDVERSNAASTGVQKSLGGTASCDCFWVRVDLGKVEEGFSVLQKGQ